MFVFYAAVKLVRFFYKTLLFPALAVGRARYAAKTVRAPYIGNGKAGNMAARSRF